MRVTAVESFSLIYRKVIRQTILKNAEMKTNKIAYAHGVCWNSWVANANH